MQETLVAINILDRYSNNLHNITENKEPILYYWNGEGDLYQNLISDKAFINKYIEKINMDDYLNLDICYFYFNNTNNDEKYISNNVRLNDIVLLENNEYDLKPILNELINDKIKKLYLLCFKEEYNKNLEIIEKIKDIYDIINEKYPNRLSIKSYINWIRSDFVKDEKLNNKNINYIINFITNSLN